MKRDQKYLKKNKTATTIMISFEVCHQFSAVKVLDGTGYFFWACRIFSFQH